VLIYKNGPATKAIYSGPDVIQDQYQDLF